MTAPSAKTPASVKTPCIGMCSTTYGDLVCRGCKRFSHEIVAWNRYNDVEKRAVLARLGSLRDQVVAGILLIDDAALLRQQLVARRIPHNGDDSVETLAYQLLRRGARHIRQLGAYGLRAGATHVHLDAVGLRDLIDAQFLALSEAHYERYIVPTVVVEQRSA